MFHPAHRGQAPAKGILHGVEQRQPLRQTLRQTLDANGKPKMEADPRGYFSGLRTNGPKNARRAQIKAAGGIRQFKKQRHAA